MDATDLLHLLFLLAWYSQCQAKPAHLIWTCPPVTLADGKDLRTGPVGTFFGGPNFTKKWVPISKLGGQMELLALIAKLATRRHHLHQLKIGSPSGTTCIGSKFGHQLASFALLPKLTVSPALLHCLGLPYWHYQLVLSWYPHQPESHQLSLHKVSYSVTDIRTQRLDPRFTWVR